MHLYKASKRNLMKLLVLSLGFFLCTHLIADQATETEIDTQTVTLVGTQESEPIIKGKLYHPGTVAQFKDMLHKYDLVVVDFYADWCHPCKQMNKVFDALIQDTALDDVLFVKVNTDAQPALSNEYNIRSLPTIILFVDGKPIRFLYGAQDKKNFKKIIQDTFRI
jgi:thioredoxin